MSPRPVRWICSWRLKISGRRTIHTQPIKKDQEIRDALRFGATTFVVDSIDELKKLTPYRARVGILLRVSFRSAQAVVDLSRKFECEPDEAPAVLPDDWHILAEPGRFLIAPAVTSVTTITGKSSRHGITWYYLDDGVYGSFSGQIFDHAQYPLQVLTNGPCQHSILAGPTCDSIDIVAEGIDLPELETGDLVIGHQMGAYTAATKTRFNLLPDANFIRLSESPVE